MTTCSSASDDDLLHGVVRGALAFGLLVDHGEYRAVWLVLVLVGLQLVLVASAFRVRRVRRNALAPA